MTYSATEIKSQISAHYSRLKRRLDHLIMLGIMPVELEIATAVFTPPRSAWWILDQIIFCRSEMEYWLEIMV